MDPSEARQRLRDFLLKETDLYKRILVKAARKDLKDICQSLGESRETFSNGEIKTYIAANYSELNKKTIAAVEEVCKNLLPEKKCIYLTKQFAIISALLIPALISLCAYLIMLIKNQPIDATNTGMCLASILILVVFLIASASFYLRSSK